MARVLDGRTDSSGSSNRSLHWGPLHSWNLFTGRVRSRISEEQTLTPLQCSRSLRNYSGEESRAGSARSRSSGRMRFSERARKGRDNLRRGQNQSVRSQRQGAPLAIDEQVAPASVSTMAGHGAVSRRRGHRERFPDTPDDSFLINSGRGGGETIAHYQHHHPHQQHYDSHHHHHHHHHHYYHHLYRQPPRQRHELQNLSTMVMDSTSHSAQRTADQRRRSGNERASISRNSRVPTSSHTAAIEARDRLAERLRGAALLSHRNSHVDLPRSFLQELSILPEDEEDTWSDDGMWELGVQDWLETWQYGEEGLQSSDMLLPSREFAVPSGLSVSAIRSLHREVFVPKGGRRDKVTGEVPFEDEDCSVCLERYLSGQVLVRLHCKHRFHLHCLTPWLESHGQCPYCRAKIVSEVADEASSRGVANAGAMDDDLMAWLDTLEGGITRLTLT